MRQLLLQMHQRLVKGIIEYQKHIKYLEKSDLNDSEKMFFLEQRQDVVYNLWNQLKSLEMLLLSMCKDAHYVENHEKQIVHFMNSVNKDCLTYQIK